MSKRDLLSRAVALCLAPALFAAFAARAADAGADSGRDTLGRFFEKAAKGGPVTVAFLGGSITEGAGASNPSKSWRALTSEWLKNRYPNAEWTFLNAGVGGTGSGLGVYRLHQEVLDRAKPDLVFVEFAVNDEYLGERAKVVAPMEGIVRQIRATNPDANIVLVYTVSRKILEAHKSGASTPATGFQKEVARHYSLPEIDFQADIFAMAESPDFRWEDYWADAAHPKDSGYALYFKRVEDFLTAQEKSPAVAAGGLPPKLVDSRLENARLIPLKTEGSKGWTSLPPRPPFHGARVESVAQATEPGSEIEVEFSGPVLGFYFESGPEAGEFEVAIDDLPPVRVQAREPVNKFVRPNYRIVKMDLPQGAHRARIVKSADGGAVRIGGLLVLVPEEK